MFEAPREGGGALRRREAHVEQRKRKGRAHGRGRKGTARDLSDQSQSHAVVLPLDTVPHLQLNPRILPGRCRVARLETGIKRSIGCIGLYATISVCWVVSEPKQWTYGTWYSKEAEGLIMTGVLGGLGVWGMGRWGGGQAVSRVTHRRHWVRRVSQRRVNDVPGRIGVASR